MIFKITKYEKPIVWLDTNFVSTMALNSDTRSARLLDFFKEKRGEYFVVKGDDTELRLGGDRIKKYSSILSQLSCGSSFLPYEIIEQFQFQKVARAVMNGEESIELLTNDYLNGDPVKQEKRAQKIGFVVGVKFNVPSLNEMTQNDKERIYQRLVTNRPHRYISEQRELEAGTPAKIFRLLLRAMTEKANVTPRPTLEKLIDESEDEEGNYFGSHFGFVSDRVQWWRDAGGNRDLLLAIKETYDFVEGEKFKKMPFNEVNNILWSDIYAGKDNLKKSDYWDVKHISALLPFCHIIFTEKRMRERLRQYKLDQKYGTRVYSMNNLDDFFADLPFIGL